MRKLHISLGLALLLLLAQYGAVLHEVSHISHAGANVRAQVHADIALDRSCQLCLAYSQVANPAGNAVNVACLEPSSCAAGATPPCSVIPRDVLAPRSRGPPLSNPIA
jgi:hypothetical protein